MMVSTVTIPEAREGVGGGIATSLALVLEYDGTSYYGFQLQAGRLTIQGEIERALAELTGERIRVRAAGRTDAGVHARGQVVSFRTTSILSCETLVSGLNYYLPGDIAIRAAYPVPDSFDVRRSPVSREYRYLIFNSRTRSPIRHRFAHRIAGDLDIDAINQACRALIGEHDFVSFASRLDDQVKNTVRTVYRAQVSRDGDMVAFDIVASAFLRHQVRCTAGSLVQVGLGKMSQDDFRAVLAAKRPGLAGPTLPARGLCLERVNYPPSFEDEK